MFNKQNQLNNNYSNNPDKFQMNVNNALYLKMYYKVNNKL